jgi:hypothetical protein
LKISEEECFCRRNGRGLGCGGEEGRQQEGVIAVWLVYLLLMGYNNGYVCTVHSPTNALFIKHGKV